jgi:hypothetical protein
MPPRAHRSILIGSLLTGLLAGCSPPGSASSTPDAALPSAIAGPSGSGHGTSATPSEPAPGETLAIMAFPRQSAITLEPGRYRSSPPFDVPFTFELDDSGWETGHLHGEFFDVLLDVGLEGVPAEWLAFAHPEYIGTEPGSSVSGLSPDAAISVLLGRTDLTVSEPEPFTLDGRDGSVVDIHANEPDTQVFGGEGGAFGMNPNLDARLAVVPLEDDLLLVIVLADPARLDAVWDHVQPILDSVDL